MNDSAPPPDQDSPSLPPYYRQLLILLVASGAVLLFIAVAILLYLGLRGPSQPIPTATPGQGIEPTVTPFVSPVPVTRCETIVSSGDVELKAALPVSLTVKNASYPVAPIIPEADAWTYPPERSGQAVWVCGTVVNYVLGLERTGENEALVEGLAPGDEVRLELSNGTVLRFRFAERRATEPGAQLALAQQQPRLTLVLPNGEAWQIALADYAAEAESAQPPPADVTAEPGETVEVGQALVTLLRSYVTRPEELGPGTGYYVTEFSVENVGDVSLTTDAFSTRLRDSLGNTYLKSRAASEAGEFGPVSGEIPPGESVRGSAGFLVPHPLPTGELSWIFSPSPAAKELSVSIPHEAGPVEDPVALQPTVRMMDAFLSDDGEILVIEGEVRNRDTRPLVVERDDISLSSTAGTSELVLAAPSLPWTIEPGEAQVIELQYRRPDASTVLLEVLGYSFEIAGL